jgi:DNA repair exonuclease SbcCD ATPase subunit
MEEIKRQVQRAQQRLVLEQFWRVFGWSLFAVLLVAAIGLAIPRIWVLNLNQQTWDLSWIGGGIAVGLLLAGVCTYLVRRTKLDAAIELDRRFGLKERVSSTLALSPSELNSDVGQALVSDAIRRVERIDVKEQFKVAPTWRLLLPLAPALAIGILAMMPSAVKKAEASAETSPEVKKQIKTATMKLQERIRENQKKAEELGLQDSDALKEVSKELDKLAGKETSDRKDALIKINDLAKDIEKRKNDLGGADKLRKELEKLKDIAKGPADKMADALRQGDFGKAQEELKKVNEELKSGTLSKEDQEKLVKQLEQLQEKLQQAAEDQKQAREQLQRQIEQKLAEGNVAEAAKMQQQLDQMNQNAAEKQEMMEQLAQKLGQASDALKEGDMKKAAEQLDKLAGDLQKAQQQLEQAENLQEVLDQLAEAKDAMNCPSCQGEGCAQCQANGQGDKLAGDKSKGKGKGMGKGRGEGERDEEETDKSFYETRVAADAKKGQSVRVGDASGPNKAGKSLESIKEEVRASIAKPPDSIEDVTLPRDQRENAKQYFERLRKGD